MAIFVLLMFACYLCLSALLSIAYLYSRREPNYENTTCGRLDSLMNGGLENTNRTRKLCSFSLPLDILILKNTVL